MNTGQFSLALKMIQEDYKLDDSQMQVLSRRLIADDREFDRLWKAFKARRLGNSDSFIDLLRELLA